MAGFAVGDQKGLRGGQWTGKLHFYPDTCSDVSRSGKLIVVGSADLVSDVGNHVGPKEKILTAEICITPLTEFQLTKQYLHHAFLILETDILWWSVEKHQDAIVMQRSKKKEHILQKCRNQTREEINKNYLVKYTLQG